MVVKGGEPEETFAVFAEPGARRADDPGLLQQQVEEVPALHPAGALHPDIGGVFAAGVADAEGIEGVREDLGVLAVVVDVRSRLGLALLGEDRFRAALDDIGDAVELGGLAAEPETVQLRPLPDERLRDDGVAAAGAGETGGLGEGAKLNRHFLRPFDLVDRAGEGVSATKHS